MNALQNPPIEGEIIAPRLLELIVGIDKETGGVWLKLGRFEIVMPREDAMRFAAALESTAGCSFHRTFVPNAAAPR